MTLGCSSVPHLYVKQVFFYLVSIKFAMNISWAPDDLFSTSSEKTKDVKESKKPVVDDDDIFGDSILDKGKGKIWKNKKLVQDDWLINWNFGKFKDLIRMIIYAFM